MEANKSELYTTEQILSHNLSSHMMRRLFVGLCVFSLSPFYIYIIKNEIADSLSAKGRHGYRSVWIVYSYIYRRAAAFITHTSWSPNPDKLRR